MKVVEQVTVPVHQWAKRLRVSSEADDGLLRELCDRLQPLLALSDDVQPEWIRMVPTSGSAWRVVPTTDSLSNDRWASVQKVANALGEQSVLVIRLDNDDVETGPESWVSQAFRIPVSLTYPELESSNVLDPINILWTNEIEHIIMGESGAWALWTITGSRADASVLSFSKESLDSELASVWLGLDLDGWPCFGGLQVEELPGAVIKSKDRSEWVMQLPGESAQRIGTANDLREFLAGKTFEWVFDDVSSTDFRYKYSWPKWWSLLWKNRD